jgi:phage gp37-like protein
MANYNIPEMLRDVRVWVAWRDANPYIDSEYTPARETTQRVQTMLLRGQEAIRQEQRQRQFTVASGLHSRSTSLLRRLNPSLVQEIAQHTRIEPPPYQPWTIWNQQ